MAPMPHLQQDVRTQLPMSPHSPVLLRQGLLSVGLSVSLSVPIPAWLRGGWVGEGEGSGANKLRLDSAQPECLPSGPCTHLPFMCPLDSGSGRELA